MRFNGGSGRNLWALLLCGGNSDTNSCCGGAAHPAWDGSGRKQCLRGHAGRGESAHVRGGGRSVPNAGLPPCRRGNAGWLPHAGEPAAHLRVARVYGSACRCHLPACLHLLHAPPRGDMPHRVWRSCLHLCGWHARRGGVAPAHAGARGTRNSTLPPAGPGGVRERAQEMLRGFLLPWQASLLLDNGDATVRIALALHVKRDE